ncbi:MAG: PH domain-containing protein [Muribaculaceae bacterium]|nr:PH domain-containing protein [Muribaculaceae bacterium]MDE6321670.1 PH domain-containing protein [Muribaculaceae bacterium]
MKSKITYSRFAIVLTAIVSGALLIGCIATVKEEATFFTLLALLILLFVATLFFGPAYIKADSDSIVMGSLLRGKRLPMRNVASVELFQPTMGAIRICASGGFLGYWGIFREGDIGRYYGFYGKASDCFLVRMKNGDKYVLGCDNPSAMVDYIKSQIG